MDVLAKEDQKWELGREKHLKLCMLCFSRAKRESLSAMGKMLSLNSSGVS